MAAPTYDVLIIGSGASGGMAAYILTKLGIECLMLEAGPPVDFQNNVESRKAYTLPFRGLGDPQRTPHVFQANEFNAHQWVDERVVPYTHDAEAPFNWVRARYVGGKSLFWSRMSFRLSDYEFQAARHDGFGDNWPVTYADLAPFYSRVEQIFRVRGRKEGWLQLPDGDFPVLDESGDSPANTLFIGEAAKLGMPVTKVRSSLGRGPLASSANLLLPDAMATGKLTIVPNAVVRNLTVDRDTGLANGADFVDRHTGRELHASARVVVLGASCLESTRILLNSGIANSSGALGRYLHDQLYITAAVQAIIPQVRDKQAPAGYAGGFLYIPRFRNLTNTREKNFIRGYAFDYTSGTAPAAQYLPYYGIELDQAQERLSGSAVNTTFMGEVLPRYENHVRINPDVKDAYGIPALHISASYGENERAMARDGVETMAAVFRACGWEVLATNDNPLPMGYSIHELGTCRMGDDPKTSVLNKWNQSHDVRNLFVVDGSSFVTGGSQNPTMTIVSLAMRASEYLAEQLRQGNL